MYTTMRALRAELATALRRAEAGQRMVITVAGRPVAQLGPVETPATAARPTLADLAARGLVLPARRVDRPPSEVLVALQVGARLDRILAEVRG